METACDMFINNLSGIVYKYSLDISTNMINDYVITYKRLIKMVIQPEPKWLKNDIFPFPFSAWFRQYELEH
jgi:hypothetical protein